jgi:uncharacterized protein YqeY
MDLLSVLQNDLAAAQKAKDELEVSTLRFVLSSIHNAKIQKGEELKDEEVVAQIQKEVKHHNESIEAFKSAGREELALRESTEKAILDKYLPQQISDEELVKIVQDAIKEVGAQTPGDFGKVMGAVMKKVGAGADGSRVSAMVKEKLANSK